MIWLFSRFSCDEQILLISMIVMRAKNFAWLHDEGYHWGPPYLTVQFIFLKFLNLLEQKNQIFKANILVFFFWFSEIFTLTVHLLKCPPLQCIFCYLEKHTLQNTRWSICLTAPLPLNFSGLKKNSHFVFIVLFVTVYWSNCYHYIILYNTIFSWILMVKLGVRREKISLSRICLSQIIWNIPVWN